ncbi:hypothetical protein BDF20DRAFT_898275 [Mycotypha africana]|uniref:uncharacterized protein n=1 Tax=Mycotypha africana TaxID=64632 RepID=UPI002300B1DB|nr:uncharacterized protein BDF20DRAFT_898275 [Mycotypha africana]KAI8967991.1 hypothetical protein BDF20DRAFT_898275 [Mycotypha africana]
MERKKSAIFQLSLLAVIQWLSIVVIILNTSALNSMRNSTNQIDAAEGGPTFTDFASLILGAISLIVASLLLCLYLHLSMGLVANSNHPIYFSKNLLTAEICLSLSIITRINKYRYLITAPLVFLLAKYYSSEVSACQNMDPSQSPTATESFPNELWHSNIAAKTCSTANAMITIGLVTICVWMIVLILSIYIYYYQLCDGSCANLLTSTFSVHPYCEQNKNTHNMTTTPIRQQAGSLRDKYSPIINLQMSAPITTSTAITKSNSNAMDKETETTTIASNFYNFSASEKATAVSMLTNNEATVVMEQEEKGGMFNYTHARLSAFSTKSTNQFTEEDVMHKNAYYPQEQMISISRPPSTSARSTARRYWDYFQFEPVNLNLMLPTTHELIGDQKRDSFYSYSYH